MITSRVSEKHRARPSSLGVDDYLGKPYQESQLLDASSRWSTAAAPSPGSRPPCRICATSSTVFWCPLAGERLIVPRACVAEVIGYQAPSDMTNAPPWYLGLVSWTAATCRSCRSRERWA